MHQIWCFFFIKTSVQHMKFTISHAWQAYQFWHQTIPDFHKTWWSCPKISNFTFELSNCFNTLKILSYLLVTLHLPQSVMHGEDSKVHKMSSTHLNLNLLDVLDCISQEDLMGKCPFSYFDFNQLQYLNPNFIIDQNLQIAIYQFMTIQFQN